MSEACESGALLIAAALKHYLSPLCSSASNFFKSHSLSSQALVTVLAFSFPKHSTVMSVRNCSNALVALRSPSSLLSGSFSAAEIRETPALASALYRALHWVHHSLHSSSTW